MPSGKSWPSLGGKKVFAEQVSSVADRPKLTAALDELREGDTLVVTKLDRLARSMRDLMNIVDKIQERQASPADRRYQPRHDDANRPSDAFHARQRRPVRTRDDAGAPT